MYKAMNHSLLDLEKSDWALIHPSLSFPVAKATFSAQKTKENKSGNWEFKEHFFT